MAAPAGPPVVIKDGSLIIETDSPLGHETASHPDRPHHYKHPMMNKHIARVRILKNGSALHDDNFASKECAIEIYLE